MPAETLLSAARRVVREFNIMMNRDGGLVSREIEQAMTQLSMQVEQEMARQKTPTLPLYEDPNAKPSETPK